LLQRRTVSQLVDVMAKARQIRDRYRYCRRDGAASALVAGRDLFLRHPTATKIEDMTLSNPFKP